MEDKHGFRKKATHTESQVLKFLSMKLMCLLHSRKQGDLSLS